jgi:predicted nucleic acid-binding protein
MWIVDSSVWIDFFNGRDSVEVRLLDSSLGRQTIGLLDLVLCEVLQGFHSDTDFRRAQAALQTFSIFETGGEALAISSALNYRVLRRRGITVRKTIDCLIATYAIEQNYALLYSDRDFDPFVEHLGLRSAVIESPLFK